MRTSRTFSVTGWCAWFLILVGTSSFALAQESANIETINCKDWKEKPLGQIEMNICAGQDAKTTQEKLARLLEELRKKLAMSSERLNRFDQNQRSWEEFAHKDCEWESASYEGGSMQPMVYALCIINARNERIDRLRFFLCEGEGTTGECSRAKAYARDPNNNPPD
jgi:uncharacterized protein YecT (DUF1311 family)